MGKELKAPIGITGLTITAQLYAAGLASGAPIACPDIAHGDYQGDMAGADGTFQVHFLDAAGVMRYWGEIIWDGSAEVMASAAERNAAADALLNRNMASGTDSGSATVRTVRQALRFLRNKWAVASGTLTVYKEDDATASFTSALSSTTRANPITGSDPTGP